MFQTSSIEPRGFIHFSSNCICHNSFKTIFWHLIYFFLCFNQVTAETVIILAMLQSDILAENFPQNAVNLCKSGLYTYIFSRCVIVKSLTGVADWRYEIN